MARMISFWRINLAAPTPADPAQLLAMQEHYWAIMDGMIKKGEIEEFGFFPDAYTGYVISKGETADFFRNAFMFLPYVINDVHEITPYEKGKEIVRATLKAQIAAMKK
jgi:hypothetical protein